MKLRLRVEGRGEIAQSFRAFPKEIRRASRRTVRQITNELHKELGGKIPRTAGVSILGYRRVRAKKRPPKANKRLTRGIVWLGTRRIAARYAGRMRDSETFGGAFAGQYFFENAFVAKFKSGYDGIFKRNDQGKLEEQYVNLPQAHAEVIAAAGKSRSRISELLQKNLEHERRKRK